MFKTNLRLRFLLAFMACASLPLFANAIRPAGAYFSPVVPQGSSAIFVRQLPLTVNDVIYNPSTQRLYASVPSSVGAGGNSIVTIDPTNGTITNSVFIGSEPNKLALSDDGTTLYVSLDGAFAIRKFDISTQTPGTQFAVGQDSFFGMYAVGDLAVAPGNPNLVAVARQYRGTSPPEAGVAIFDNGVQRPTTGPGHISGSDYLSFSASASKLYGSGFYSGLTTLSITANGVSIASATSLGSGWRVKFDNGRVYAGNGQVIDPDASSLMGTFSGVTGGGGSVAFVPESSAGRAYYLFPETFGSQNRTLRAFDTNTFLPISSVTVPGVTGDVSNMVRWGSNGLAFRTSGGQLFLIQTNLIPSADSIPTPTPTPSPTPSPSPSPIATFIRQINLPSNDLIFNSSSQVLYASVPSSAGATRGNTITSVNPVTATIGSSAFVGSEPGKIALADDAQTLYVGLNGAAAVRRFDLSTFTPGLQFSLGNDSNGPRFPSDVAVMPGTPATVAVTSNSGGTSLFDNGVARAQSHNTSGSLQFRSSSTLYLGINNQVRKLAVSAAGLSLASSTATGTSGSIIYAGGLVYQAGGAVVDPEVGSIKGTFSGVGFSSLMAIDVVNNRAFFLTGCCPFVLRAYDLNTFVPLGSITIQGVVGTPTSLVRWGSNGLAFRTSNSQIFLIQTALVNAGDSVPSPTPTPSPTPSPSPPYFATFVRKVDLHANDLIYNSPTNAIYASVASFQGAAGNSVTRLDPSTGVVGQSVFIGSEPNRIAPSDDGATLHVSLDGAAAIRRFDIPTMTPGMQFPWGNSSQHPSDMIAVPGSPGSIATTDGAVGLGVAVYDNGVRRTNTSRGNAYGIGLIVFGANASTIYGYDTFSSGFELVKFSVNASGVTAVSTTNNLLQGFGGSIKFANGLLYSSFGRICDPETSRLVATIGSGNVAGNTIVVDTALGRIFTVGNSGSSNITLTAYDINTFVPLGSAVVAQGVSGAPTSLVRWGANGLAFRVAPNFGLPGQQNPSAVYLLQSILVSAAAPVPTGLQLSTATLNTFEGVSNLSITVTRNGDISGTTTVDYGTSGGTATAGSDYTATSGTLTFLPNEQTKTIALPIANDTLYEGATETFNLTLSNPSGGAVLGTPSSATVAIADNDFKPIITFALSFNRAEGNAPANFTFPVNLSNPSVQTLTVNYTTADGTAAAGSDYVATSGTLTFPPGSTTQSISVTVNGDTTVEPDETFFLRLSNATNATSIGNPQSTVTLTNDDTSVQLSAAYSVNEADGLATITVNRLGLLSGATTVRFATSDTAGLAHCATIGGPASERCDYTTSLGTLTFTAGQSSRTFTVPVINDVWVEGNEAYSVTLSSPTGATLPGPFTAPVTIIDNDTSPATTNPIDGVDFFILQQYRDILGRQPDQTGFQNWVNTLAPCPNGGFGEPPTSNCDRLHVAAGFFQSDEFLNRGYWAFRFYMVSFDQRPTYAQFIPDMSQVGGPKSPAEEETSKVAFADAFVQRPEFLSRYGSLTGQALADALLQTAGLPAGSYQAGSQTNGQILRGIAQSQGALDKFLTEGTVSILYFGFQRRDPDAIGYQNNLDTLNASPNNLRHMIFIFIYSTEYRGRFGPP